MEQSEARTVSRVLIGVVSVLVLLAVNLVIGGVLLARRAAAPPVAAAAPAPAAADPDAGVVHVGVAYGTEKERWLAWAAGAFAATPAGRGVKVDLIPMGSLEGAQAVLKEDHRIDVWCPASRLYREQFVADWTARHGADPIAREDRLALTPMAFVMWDERYRAFTAKYGDVSFRSVGQALAEPGGWAAIANRPDWGLFKFSHTVPTQSNSGLAALVTMAYDYHGKPNGLTLADALDGPFQQWLGGVERGASDMQNSTGNMMRDMVLFGPGTFDCLYVYESVAIDYLDNANGRWGKLHVSYPKYNLWNDNPYYVLDVPWSTPAQREGAGAFLDFLMAEPAQREAMRHGFRPGNPAVPTNGPADAWARHADVGLRADLPGTICKPPPAEVMFNLLQGWERTRGSR